MSNIIKVTNGDTVYITVSDVFTIKPNTVTATELNVSGNGTSGQVLSSDGDGSFSWVAQSAGSAGVGLALTGNTFSLSHLGLESLSDPNADRIAFWDDSTSTFAWLEIGGNLTISGTTLNATDTQRSVETIQDIVGDMFTLGNTETLITATYQDSDGTIDLVVDNDLANYDNSTSGFLTAHPTITAASSVDNSGRTYIQDITLDSNGHVTGLVSATETVTDTTYDISSATNVADANDVDIKLVGSDATTDTVTLVAGTNITLSDDGSNNITITSTASGGGGGMTSWTISDGTNSEDINDGEALTIAGGGDVTTSYSTATNILTVSFTETYTAHESISAATSADNSGNTFIQDITLDSNGHVTGLVSTAVSNLDNYQYWTISDGTNTEAIASTNELIIAGGGDVTTSYASATNTMTVSFTETYTAHESIAAPASVDNSGRTYIQDITLDSNGHVTGIASATETVTDTTYDLSSATNTGNTDNVDIKLTGSDSTTDTITLVAGTGIDLTDNGSNQITIDASGGGSTYTAALV